MGIPLNIDFRQILLHVFNFLILFGGLYLLLYKPVKAFMEKRKAHYAEMEEEAKEKQKEAEANRLMYLEKLENAEAEIAEMKKKAADEANQAADAYLKDAKAEKDALLLKAKKDAEAEKEKILAKANSSIEDMVSKAIDKALSENSDPIEDFLSKAEEKKEG